MSDTVSRLNEALQGRYAIESNLGEGGMATVYLADDLKHERKVALKVLKPELAAVVGAERFLSEIKVTANLQHPNILPLFDSGEADSFLFYVMPYVEGETLRERLDREQQLHVDEALKIALDLAEALEHAHRQGVVHRDIKPANVLLRDGRPLIADFGIALAVGSAGGARLTETGLSVGTPYYMSPEQATGDQVISPASDTYALGCVLYEMLVGEPPYPGATAQAVLGKIIAGDPVSATKQRPSIPAHVDAAIRCALEKLPADRFMSTQDFGNALADEHFRYGAGMAGTVGAGAGPWNRLTRVMTALAAISTLGLGWALFGSESSSAPRPVTRVSVVTPEDQSFNPIRGEMDLSADGSMMVYRAVGPEETQLRLRRWSALEGTLIPDTENGNSPAISPDGREVAFASGSTIRVVPLRGGVSRTLTDSGLCCPEWSPDGAWIYYVDLSFGLSRVPAGGGATEVVTQLDASVGESIHAFVAVLPGGKGIVYMVEDGANTNSRIRSLNLETGETKELTRGETPRYSATGHLLFMDVDEQTLLAAPFDVKTLELTGPATPIAEGVMTHTQGWRFYDISETGRLVYRTGGTTGQMKPAWVERDGVARDMDPEWSTLGSQNYSSLALSPDGTRLVASVQDADRTHDLWVKQLDDGPLSRLTFEGTENIRAVWSPDGRTMTFISNRSGQRDIWTKRADGGGPAELVLDRERPIQEFQYSPDGTWLVFVESDGGTTNSDIYAIRPGVDSVATPLVTEGAALEISLSPDGRWLAYTWSRSGDIQVYVRPFPDVNSGRWQVSTNRGDEPVWAHSGRELFYQGTGNPGEQMVAEISVEPFFAVGRRQVLFQLDDYLNGNGHAQYDVSSDDQRFVMFRTDRESSELILVENWVEELGGAGNQR